MHVRHLPFQVELVDRQLMASLMGEWGMLQQLEGLVNAFLVSSPSMVEWVEALFTAVEVAKASNSSRARGTGEGTTPPASRTLARTAAAAAGGAWVCDSPGAVASPSGHGGSGANVLGKIPVGVEDLELPSLEAMLKVGQARGHQYICLGVSGCCRVMQLLCFAACYTCYIACTSVSVVNGSLPAPLPCEWVCSHKNFKRLIHPNMAWFMPHSADTFNAHICTH
jgi:hypothetical protein